MKKPTSMERRQLIIQVKDDKDGCQAVIPVHPGILGLDSSLLTDEACAIGALKAAREQFETDSNAYIEALKTENYRIHPSLKLNEYRQWNDGWRFDFFPHHGILAMRWGLDEPEPYEIGLCPYDGITNGIILEEHGEIADIEEIEMAPNAGILYGSTRE